MSVRGENHRIFNFVLQVEQAVKHQTMEGKESYDQGKALLLNSADFHDDFHHEKLQ